MTSEHISKFMHFLHPITRVTTMQRSYNVAVQNNVQQFECPTGMDRMTDVGCSMACVGKGCGEVWVGRGRSCTQIFSTYPW